MTTECKMNHGGGSTCANSNLEGGGSAGAGHRSTAVAAMDERSSLCVDDLLPRADPQSGIVLVPDRQESPNADLISIVIDMLLPAVPVLESAGIRHIANDVSCACKLLRWVQTHPDRDVQGVCR